MTKLPVHLYGVHIGNISDRGPGRVGFRSTNEGIRTYGLGSTILSMGLPLTVLPSDDDAATSFFGGILPEGRGRTNLARQAGVQNTDLFAMLEYAGKDVPGAVIIGESSAVEPGSHEQADEHDIEMMLNRTSDFSMGATGGGGSLPGIQPKAVLAWIDGWHFARNGAMSTHILKPVAVGEEWSAHWEAYCLSLGRKLGLLSFAATVKTFGERTALVVERYDRVTGPNNFERIHQEDAAQALGLPWDTDAKFESVDRRAGHRSIADLLPRVRRLGSERGDRHVLLAYATFNVAIGNTDAHAKNFSIIHTTTGKVRLAPMYVVTALALAPNGQQKLALRVNDIAYQPSVRAEDLVLEGMLWGLEEPAAKEVVTGTLEALRRAVDETELGQADAIVGRYIRMQVDNLLGGKAAWESGAPAYLRLF